MATADTRSSLVVVKEFTYRGGTQRWSNRYHCTGPLAMTLTKFNVLADAVIADEAPVLPAAVTIVQVYWNDATDATATNPHGTRTFDKPVSVAGTRSTTGTVGLPGDAAAFIRYLTDARTSNNHPIYLFNFYHGIGRATSDANDVLDSASVSALQEYGDDWLAGFSDGVDTRIRCGPHGAVAQSRHVPTYISHRDFPR